MPPTRKLFPQICTVLFLLATISSVLRAQGTGGNGIGNTTSTPVPGVPHDYIVSLNEIVNPANGALSIRIAQPVPHERGQNWPKYAFLYDSNQQFSLYPGWSSIVVGNTTYTVLETLNYGPPAQITAPPGDVASTSTQMTRCVQYNQLNCNTYTCIVTAGFTYTDPDGGQHGLGLQVATPNTQNTSNDCNEFQASNYLVGGDEQYKATINPTTLAVTVIDTHGNQPTIEDTNGNYRNTTGRTAPLPTTYTIQNETVNTSQSFNAIPNSQQNQTCKPTSILTNTLSGGGSLSFTAPKSVTLANGEQYTFGYDPNFGLINKITYPTGGWALLNAPK